MKNPFKKQDNLSKELSMLPRETKKRILENVTKRTNEILEERLIARQLKSYQNTEKQTSKRTWGSFKQGMQSRREELKKQGILKPLIRYDKKNFQSPLQEASKKARQIEIKRLEKQRIKLKRGYSNKPTIKLKKLKLKAGKTLKNGLH